jgi:hypothetical protein
MRPYVLLPGGFLLELIISIAETALQSITSLRCDKLNYGRPRSDLHPPLKEPCLDGERGSKIPPPEPHRRVLYLYCGLARQEAWDGGSWPVHEGFVPFDC